jgi:hypothetical protein
MVYEFSDSQNGLIKDLSQKMQFVGIFSIVFGILAALGGLIVLISRTQQGGVSSVIQGVVAVLVGIWTISAAKSFRLIVDTQGNDLENLIGALGELRKLYGLQYWILLIGLIFVAIAFVIGLISSLAGGAR